MKNRYFKNLLFLLVFLVLFFFQPADNFRLFAQITFDKDQITPEIYKTRRQKVLKAMEPNSIAIIKSANEKNRNGDTDFLFRQNSTLYYLTGSTESESILLLSPAGIEIDGKKVNEILFLKERNPMAEQWTGKLIGTEGAKTILGLEASLQIKNFGDFLKKTASNSKIIYLQSDYSENYHDLITDKKYNFDQERKKSLQDSYPGLEIKNFSAIINPMRVVKSPEEIDLIQKAINATAKGYIEAIKSCEPDMYEFELQGIIEYSMKRSGCEYTGFPSIVGSGPNSLTFHYESDTRQMKDGEVVLMDIGGEYHGYSADISRTVPVNGTFSQPQKDIYNIVYKANQEIINTIKPGTDAQSFNKMAIKIVGEGLMQLGIIKNPSEANKFLPHGVSHDVGLEVHDVSVRGPLKAGQIITVEPGIYISPNMAGVDPKYWNIGVRIEDDILVTETGHKVLTECAPKTIEEIEKIMKKKGIGNQVIGE